MRNLLIAITAVIAMVLAIYIPVCVLTIHPIEVLADAFENGTLTAHLIKVTAFKLYMAPVAGGVIAFLFKITAAGIDSVF